MTPQGKRQIREITIYLDPRRDGRVRLVIHELLHAYFGLSPRMVYEVEEAIVLSLEKLLYDYLHAPKRERLLESWSRAIERKLSC